MQWLVGHDEQQSLNLIFNVGHRNRSACVCVCVKTNLMLAAHINLSHVPPYEAKALQISANTGKVRLDLYEKVLVIFNCNINC